MRRRPAACGREILHGSSQSVPDSRMGRSCVVLASVIFMASVVSGRAAAQASSSDADQSFRAANELARAGDLPKAIESYRALSAKGVRSASLYWNWAQAAQVRGLRGEALWALLNARELEPWDPALRREIEHLREVLSLDPAEIAPDPLAYLARISRRFHFAALAASLLLASVIAHLLRRLLQASGLATAAWAFFVVGVIVSLAAFAAFQARPLGVVLRAGAPLLDSASSMAESIGALREGEVVPLLDRSLDYVRVQDSSGARGWAHVDDVRELSSH